MTFIKGCAPWNKGKRYSAKHKGRKLSNRHRKALMGRTHSGSGVYKRSEYHRRITSDGLKRFYKNGGVAGFRKKAFVMAGDKNTNWKGGTTTVGDKFRKSVEYRLWREAVFARDGWTCQLCGKRGGTELHADHIKMFAFHPDLRLAIDNGRTPCISCHKKTKTYMSKKHVCCI